MKVKSLFILILLTSQLSIHSQDWIGIGSGTSHMEIKDSIIYVIKGTGKQTIVNIPRGSIGEFMGRVIDPDTGEDKYGVIIQIFENRDSIKYKSLNGEVINTFYKGNKFKRKYPFRFYSISLEVLDPYKLVNRFEIIKYGRFDKNKYGRFEYYKFEDNIRLVKELESEIIDSLDTYTQYLDIENMSADSFPWVTVDGHCCDYSITITDDNFIKYQFIGRSIPYHFRPIENLLRKLKDEE